MYWKQIDLAYHEGLVYTMGGRVIDGPFESLTEADINVKKDMGVDQITWRLGKPW